MANHWFKFFGGEYLSDPKMLALGAGDRSCWITLLCYASVGDGDGVIRYLSEAQLMAQAGVNVNNTKEWNDAKGVLDRLQHFGMLQQSNGEIIIKNWQKRQETYLTNAERQARYRNRFPEKSRVGVYNARLKKMGIDPQEWEKIKEENDYSCASCEKSEPEVQLTLDHIIPTSKGGTNELDNIQPLCKSCNSSKKDKVSNLEVTGSNNGSNARTEENRTEENRLNTAMEEFKVFWAVYPRKDGKKKAEQAWRRIDNKKTPYEAILAGLKRHMDSEQWTKDDGRFIPHAATWINGERWNDELKAGKKKKSTKYDNISTTTIRQ